jgi:hypothetical protein
MTSTRYILLRKRTRGDRCVAGLLGTEMGVGLVGCGDMNSNQRIKYQETMQEVCSHKNLGGTVHHEGPTLANRYRRWARNFRVVLDLVASARQYICPWNHGPIRTRLVDRCHLFVWGVVCGNCDLHSHIPSPFAEARGTISDPDIRGQRFYRLGIVRPFSDNIGCCISPGPFLNRVGEPLGLALWNRLLLVFVLALHFVSHD